MFWNIQVPWLANLLVCDCRVLQAIVKNEQGLLHAKVNCKNVTRTDSVSSQTDLTSSLKQWLSTDLGVYD